MLHLRAAATPYRFNYQNQRLIILKIQRYARYQTYKHGSSTKSFILGFIEAGWQWITENFQPEKGTHLGS